MLDLPPLSRAALRRCPFVRLVAADRIAEAHALAAVGPEPAEPVVAAWLVVEARRQLALGGSTP